MLKRIIFLCLAFLTACVVQRNVVRQPELTLQVTDGTVPLSSVSVYLFWISDPHNKLEHAQTFTTDETGNLRLEEVLQQDRAYPFMMHGVGFYQHELCLEKAGYQSLFITFSVNPGEALNLVAPLSEGESPRLCSSYEGLGRRVTALRTTLRPDILAQHPSIRAAFEVTP
jgi:hypothetical protein